VNGPAYNPGPGPDISLEPNPEADRARRRIALILTTAISLMCVGGGISRIVQWQSSTWVAVGLGLVIIGLPIPIYSGRSLWRWMVGMYRVNHDQCIHCGYSISGLISATCPECGRDPF